MPASYHNHTSWSDGKGTVAELIEHARTLGLDELGISDHFTLHPAGRPVSWSMPVARVGEYVREVLSAGEDAPGGPTLRVGLEVDWFPGHAPSLTEALDGLPLDFTIGSVHFVRGVEIDGRPALWEQWTPAERDEVHREYWQLISEMAATGLFDIVGHIDLTKKFGFHPQPDVQPLINETLDAVAEAGMVVELNTNGWHCPCAEPYPGAAILAECRARDIPVTLSADAHRPVHLARDFAAAAELLRAAGYTEVARFAGRRVSFESLDSAVPAGS